MKTLKIIFYTLLVFICLCGMLLFIWNLSYLSEFGKISFGRSKNAYFSFYQAVDISEEYDNLNFDFYRNDTLIVKQKYFDSTDGEPKISDIKIREYDGMFYVTNFDSTKVKIICDKKLNIIYPINYGEIEDSTISNMPEVKRMLINNKLTLGRW